MRLFNCLAARRNSCLTAFVFVLAVSLALGVTNWVAAQNATDNTVVGFGYQRAVGGISINADGLLENAGTESQGKLAKLRAEMMHKLPADLNASVPLRKISLRRLDAAIQEALKAGKQLPDEVLFLSGLQEVRYVFVYPEQKDIVIVGPAEGWKVDGRGNVVGVSSGKPVMHLDDLLVALRTASGPAQSGITCSIDPTPEGLQQLKSQASKLRTMQNPESTAAAFEQALGRQQITFSGVPATSRFAGVLVGADYQMKRLAMNFDPSPVRGLPSFLQMMGGTGRGMSNMMPRWWLEPTYESVLRDASGTAWELRGCGVKCMTEEDFVSASGNVEHKGKANPMAQKWADAMTARYGELAVAQPVFGELRNCMELAVVGALIASENLLQKAGCTLPVLMDSAALKTAKFAAPTQVDSKVSMIKKGRNWIISASGGVAIRPYEFVAKAQNDAAPVAAREKAMPSDTGKWYWN